MNSHQNAHTHVLACLSALRGIQDLVDDPIARIAQRAGYERQDGLADLKRFAADLCEGLKATEPLLPESESVWAEARRQRGPVRLCGEAVNSAHKLVIVLSCRFINGLRLATAPLGHRLSPGWTPEAITMENLARCYELLAYRRLERADLDSLWLELDWEHAATARQDGGRAEARPRDASGKGGEDDKEDQWSELRKWAMRRLKGKQRRVVELVIESGGECPLSDVATDEVIAWERPFDDPFNSMKKALNPKLKRFGWKLDRNDNKARLAKIGQI